MTLIVFLMKLKMMQQVKLPDMVHHQSNTTTCGTIFNKWIDYLDVQLSFLVIWPSRKAVNDHMPPSFRAKYPICRVIVDCTEIRTETPSSLQSKSLMYSDYKSHMT
uniref:DDE Tnp4 domain-containing protein n=1 Tax=Octopus bimaculoides TaxID=37653 RepID=A0A0L8I6I0_OCTBM